MSSDPRFGGVSNYDTQTMLALYAERGGDPERAGKKDPLDCLLWQATRPDEPSWDSPYGPGRPGWHIECTAIVLNHLGETIDVMGGGNDLSFPHHEMGNSEAVVATGVQPFARAFVHAGMVGLHGEKMSKSKGNLLFVSTLRSHGVDASVSRLALLSDHYRVDRDWTQEHVDVATERLARWRDAVAVDSAPSADQLLADVRRHLADDLNTPLALAAIDRWAEESRLRGGTDSQAPQLVRDLCHALLGVKL